MYNKINMYGFTSVVACVFFAFQLSARAETYTLETYYPSPAGVYNNMSVLSGAVLARDSGNVVLVSPANTTGLVGIGTASPVAKLDVNGNANIQANLSCGGNVSGANVLAGGRSVITSVICSGSLTCTISGNTLIIKGKEACISDGSCSALPGCGETVKGVDNCGNVCSTRGAPCKYQCPSIRNSGDMRCCTSQSSCTGQLGASQTCTYYYCRDGDNNCDRPRALSAPCTKVQ